MYDTRLTVGSRELKTRLGTYLQQVRDGATILVTDRGQPVAELRPLRREPGALGDRLRELQAIGLVTCGVSEPTPLACFNRLPNPSHPASELILQDREDRF